MYKKKIRKVKPHTLVWERKANWLARSFAPPIFACKKCGNPVVQGYCCIYCGDSDPESEE